MSVSFVGLREQYESLKTKIDAAIASVVGRSAFVGGPELEDFQRWFASFCGARHALGVSSGTRAIELALRALGIGSGDEVIAPANTFIATAAAISAVGARPVFADVEEASGNLDPVAFQRAITAKTKAVVPVHLYGRPASMHEILSVASAHGLPVIEDAAQAHGAKYRGVRVGGIGTAGCFSFYPTKNLGAFGDGGLVTTNDEGLAARVALLRDHGRSSKYEHEVIGYTARLDNLQAAVLRVQADALDAWNARRREVAWWYRAALPNSATPLADDPADEAVYHLYIVRVPRRDEFRSHLASHGIDTGIHYPLPLHLQPAYRELRYNAGDFPVAERLAKDIVSLPMHPFLQRSQVDYVTSVAADFLARC